MSFPDQAIGWRRYYMGLLDRRPNGSEWSPRQRLPGTLEGLTRRRPILHQPEASGPDKRARAEAANLMAEAARLREIGKREKRFLEHWRLTSGREEDRPHGDVEATFSLADRFERLAQIVLRGRGVDE